MRSKAALGARAAKWLEAYYALQAALGARAASATIVIGCPWRPGCLRRLLIEDTAAIARCHRP
jgi:hypothetical protein